MAGLWSDAPDPETGEIADSYTVVIDEANAAIHIHSHMPVILDAEDAASWLYDKTLPVRLLKPYLAESMTGWRVPDAAKNSRTEPSTEMSKAVEAGQ